MQRPLLLLSLALSPVRAYAEQCMQVSASIAGSAAERLKKGEVLQEICRACGEVKARPLWIDHTIVTKAGAAFEVQVNGRSLDLAYVFIKDGRGDWINLGLTVHCGATAKDVKGKLRKSDLIEP